MIAPIEWDAVRERAVTLMSQYVQIDTTNPPGNEMVAAEWLRDQLVETGVTTDITIYETAPRQRKASRCWNSQTAMVRGPIAADAGKPCAYAEEQYNGRICGQTRDVQCPSGSRGTAAEVHRCDEPGTSGAWFPGDVASPS